MTYSWSMTQQGVVYFEILHVTHFYKSFFKFNSFRSIEDHLEGPGVLREEHTQGLHRE